MTTNGTSQPANNLDEILTERQQLFAAAAREENRILRESLALLKNYVDPTDALRHEGEIWEPLGGSSSHLRRSGFNTPQELSDVRQRCRALALTNEFAINGHENRISYVIGRGFVYRVLPRRSSTEPEAQQQHLVAAAREVIDEFLELTSWRKRQIETLRRMDRDGEAFLWFFADESGRTQVRFIEPELVATPEHAAHDPAAAFGIVTEPDDAEHVLAYWVAGEQIAADEIQHRKAHVDASVRRGIPLFYPVLRALRWAENLLRNMAAVSDIQTAIALIRKHHAAGRSPLEALRSGAATVTTDHPATGRAYFQEYRPGTILDVYADTEYDFPARGLDASRYVLVLQAILRAVASRLVMPEFMLTSDASNANYSSTLVAEGPAVKMFERLQLDACDDDAVVMRRVLTNAAAAGRLPQDILRRVRVHIEPPRVATRNELDEARVNQILVRAGAMSAEMMGRRHGVGSQR